MSTEFLSLQPSNEAVAAIRREGGNEELKSPPKVSERY